MEQMRLVYIGLGVCLMLFSLTSCVYLEVDRLERYLIEGSCIDSEERPLIGVEIGFKETKPGRKKAVDFTIGFSHEDGKFRCCFTYLAHKRITKVFGEYRTQNLDRDIYITFRKPRYIDSVVRLNPDDYYGGACSINLGQVVMKEENH